MFFPNLIILEALEHSHCLFKISLNFENQIHFLFLITHFYNKLKMLLFIFLSILLKYL